jgi:hypothetical protein
MAGAPAVCVECGILAVIRCEGCGNTVCKAHQGGAGPGLFCFTCSKALWSEQNATRGTPEEAETWIATKLRASQQVAWIEIWKPGSGPTGERVEAIVLKSYRSMQRAAGIPGVAVSKDGSRIFVLHDHVSVRKAGWKKIPETKSQRVFARSDAREALREAEVEGFHPRGFS